MSGRRGTEQVVTRFPGATQPSLGGGVSVTVTVLQERAWAREKGL